MEIYLAGAHLCLPLLADGHIKRGFLSFIDFKNGKSDRLLPTIDLAHSKHGTKFIMDSGAHSFFTQTAGIAAATHIVRKNADPDVADPTRFFAKYLEFLKSNLKSIDYYVELDIGKIVGQPTVYKWRKQLERAGLADKAILVYHPKSETWAEFQSRVKKWPSKYIGFEGPNVARGFDYMPCVKWCYENGIKCHGFACVKRRFITTIPFYSVDSTSWNAGLKFNNHMLHTKSLTMQSVRFRGKPTGEALRKLQRAAMDFGIELIGAQGTRDTYTVLLASVKSNEQMSVELTRLWKGRGVDWSSK